MKPGYYKWTEIEKQMLEDRASKRQTSETDLLRSYVHSDAIFSQETEKWLDYLASEAQCTREQMVVRIVEWAKSTRRFNPGMKNPVERVNYLRTARRPKRPKSSS